MYYMYVCIVGQRPNYKYCIVLYIIGHLVEMCHTVYISHQTSESLLSDLDNTLCFWCYPRDKVLLLGFYSVVLLASFNSFPIKPWFLCVCHTSLLKTLRKAEIACDEQFLLFPTVFSTHLENFLPFSSNLKLLSANSVSSKECKICHFGKGLRSIFM